MISHFNIIHKNAHRALGDATATTKLFLKLIEKLKDDYNYENISNLWIFKSISKFQKVSDWSRKS